MSYRVNEIFTSLQGEGVNAGLAALFVRMSGCNLRCPFCDTDHHSYQTLNVDDICRRYAESGVRLVVLTGGEPALQVDQALVDALHACGAVIAIETNGTMPLPDGIDHVTISPKDAFCPHAQPVTRTCDELKVVWRGDNDPEAYADIEARWRVIQPCDTGDSEENARLLRQAADYCLRSGGRWRLGLQMHKIIGIR